MNTGEKVALTAVVIAVVVFAVWGAREIVKNNARDFGGVEKEEQAEQKTEFSLKDIVTEITQ